MSAIGLSFEDDDKEPSLVAIADANKVIAEVLADYGVTDKTAYSNKPGPAFQRAMSAAQALLIVYGWSEDFYEQAMPILRG